MEASSSDGALTALSPAASSARLSMMRVISSRRTNTGNCGLIFPKVTWRVGLSAIFP